MNSLKKFIQTAKILAFTLLLVILCFPTAAMAQEFREFYGLPEKVCVLDGSFNVNKTDELAKAIRVDSAVINLPPRGEDGFIDELVIFGPGGEQDVEYQCPRLQVRTGIDLITQCGGPAYLKKGKTTYKAKGSDFGPEEDTILKIDLEFEEQE